MGRKKKTKWQAEGEDPAAFTKKGTRRKPQMDRRKWKQRHIPFLKEQKFLKVQQERRSITAESWTVADPSDYGL